MKFKQKVFFAAALAAVTWMITGSGTALWGQTAYYDALKLARYINPAQKPAADGKITFSEDPEKARDALAILAAYADSETFKNNPFLDPTTLYRELAEGHIEPVIPTKSTIPGEQKPFYKGIESWVVPSLAGTIFKFVADRVSEQTVETFFVNFQKAFLADENEPLRVLFPQTYRQMKKIGSQVHHISPHIKYLCDKFRIDLANLYYNCPQLLKLEQPAFATYLQKRPEVKILVMRAYVLVEDLIKKSKHPAIILENLKRDLYPLREPGKPGPGLLLYNLDNAAELLKLLSNSLVYKAGGPAQPPSQPQAGTEQFWLHREDLSALFREDENGQPTIFKIYLGLLYQLAEKQAVDFVFKEKNTGKEVHFQVAEFFAAISDNKDNRQNFMNLMDHFLSLTDLLSSYKEEIRRIEAAEETPSIDDYYRYHDTAVEILTFSSALFNYVEDIAKNKENIVVDETGTIAPGQFQRLVRLYAEMLRDVQKEDFNSPVLGTLGIFDEIFKDFNDKKKLARVREKIASYGTFMARVVDVDDPAELKAVVKDTVLPPGSFSLKRNSSFTISLNAFLGLALSDEHLRGESGKEKRILHRIDGLYLWAPLGIDFSTRTRFGCIGSSSLFLSIIDLGAVAAFRLDTDSSGNIPEFTLKNIIAPGAHLSFGLKKLPLSFGAGIQYGPQLRKLSTDDEEGTIIEAGAWRFNFFFAIDIPLLNIK